MAICELCENREAEMKVGNVPNMGEYEFDVCKPCLLAFHHAAQQLLAPDVCPVCEGSGKSFAPLFSSDEACPACNGQNAGKA